MDIDSFFRPDLDHNDINQHFHNYPSHYDQSFTIKIIKIDKNQKLEKTYYLNK